MGGEVENLSRHLLVYFQDKSDFNIQMAARCIGALLDEMDRREDETAALVGRLVDQKEGLLIRIEQLESALKERPMAQLKLPWLDEPPLARQMPRKDRNISA